jgi:hypothetical protein
LRLAAAVNDASARHPFPDTKERTMSPIWLLVLILLIIAVAGGVVISKFLFLILIIVVIVALVGGRGA